MHTKKSKIWTGLFSLLLVLGIIFPMLGALKQISAATNDPVTIKITNAYKGATYKGWKILNATETDQYVSGTSGAKKLQYSVPDAAMRTKLATALNMTQGTDTDAVFDNKIIQKLSEMTNDSDALKTFARKMYDLIKDDTASLASTQTTDGTAGSQDSTVTWNDAATGYYLLSEDTSTIATADQAAGYKPSLTVLNAVADSYATNGVLSITMKHDNVPTVEKYIKEDNDDTTATATPLYRKGADHDIGDTISFRLQATVPDNVAEFQKYFMTFVDTLSKGLTYDSGSVKVYKVASANVSSLTNNVATLSGQTWATTVDNSEYTVTATTNTGASNTLTIALSDLTGDVAAGDKIVVEYTAKLNSSAVIGSVGNPNSVYLTYASDPKATDGGTPGRTPEDKVIDFTFQVDANKVDGAGAALAGAGFTLYKKTNNASDTDFSTTTTGWKKVKEIAAADNKTAFSFAGLDAGTYKLVETTVPSGYNKAADIDFTVVPTFAADKKSITKLEIKDATNKVIGSTDAADATNTKVFTVDLTAGKASTNVVNNSGKQLPSTGGMGTVLLYTAGAILAVGAGVYLIVKRRTTVK